MNQSHGPEVTRYKKNNQTIVVFEDGCMVSMIEYLMQPDGTGHTAARYSPAIVAEMHASGYTEDIEDLL